MYDRGWDPDGEQRQTEAVLSATDRSSLMGAVTAPTTIVHGSADRLIDPAASVRLHELIEGSTLTVYPGMGHELPVALWDAIVDQVYRNALRAGHPVGLSTAGRPRAD
jgi:pimeloyl-ACP methyl ester carboxylesterase